MPPSRNQRKDHKAPAPTAIATATPAATTSALVPTATPEEHIKRPLNDFFLFRQEIRARLKSAQARQSSKPETNLSGIFGKLWANAPDCVRRYYKQAANAAKAEHERKYPNYKYRPLPKEQRLAKRQADKAAAKAAKDAAKAAAVLDPTQVVAALPRASMRRARKAQMSAASDAPPVAGPSRLEPAAAAALPDAAVLLLPDPKVEEWLSAQIAELVSGGETVAVEATAPAFPPAPVPGPSQPMAQGFPPAVGPYLWSTPVQWSPSQVPNDDLLPGPAMGTQASSSGSEPRSLSCEWIGPPPRLFFDPAFPFPAHLPAAGSVEPIDWQDAMYALDCARSGNGEAWVAPPPQMDPGVSLSSFGPAPGAAYDYPPANGADMLAPAMNTHAVYQAMGSTADIDAALPHALEYALDPLAQEPIASAESPVSQSLSPPVTESFDYAPAASPGFAFTDPSQQSIGGGEDFYDAMKAIDEVFAMLGVPMPVEPSL
ncbi:hypothetical protein TRAPUB_4931 [Trametes pubescens]|uniref:HMG box domain-containing protein n=1 Tax=Trametes pubescens TaxID=154538 RepID=A0A1M2V9S9_TRAPU|nr:hypothetical protein TRAPUB_4931 [Trametes pubescens]